MKPCKRGHVDRAIDGRCRECRKAAKTRYYIRNKETVIAKAVDWQRQHREEHSDYVKAWKKKNSAKVKIHAVRWAKANPEHHAKLKLRWQQNNRARVAAFARAYQAKRLKATPSWLTADDHWLMREAYDLAVLRAEATGIPWHVDHVFPLQGRNVCGLHVPLNLQVIPAVQNISKGNHYVSG